MRSRAGMLKKKKKPSRVSVFRAQARLCGTRQGLEGHLRRQEYPCNQCLVGSATYTEAEIRTLIYAMHDKNRDQQLWNKYKISLATFERIFIAQDRRCACCGTSNPGSATWHVDHDHVTDLVRGILCSTCNTGIGQLGDNLQGVQKAVVYLQTHAKRGGYQCDPQPPKSHGIGPPEISAIMRRCFDFFTQGASKAFAVGVVQVPPEVIEEIYALWKDRGGVVQPVNCHHFQIPKDLPLRVACACGFEVKYTDEDSRSTAVERVNTHLREVDPKLEAEAKLKVLWAKASEETPKKRQAEL